MYEPSAASIESLVTRSLKAVSIRKSYKYNYNRNVFKVKLQQKKYKNPKGVCKQNNTNLCLRN